MDLSTRILGPSSLVQTAIVEILEKTPKSYYDNIMNTVQVGSFILFVVFILQVMNESILIMII